MRRVGTAFSTGRRPFCSLGSLAWRFSSHYYSALHKLFLIPVLLSSFLSIAAAQDLKLKLTTLRLEGGSVEFKSIECGKSEAQSVGLASTWEASAEKFNVHVSKKVTYDSVGYFLYSFYVRSKSGPSDLLSCFGVQATPSGTFLDQGAEVIFQIEGQGAPQTGTIRIPIYNSSLKILRLEASPPARLFKVNYGTEFTSSISLINHHEDLPVVLLGPLEFDGENKGDWEEPRKVGFSGGDKERRELKPSGKPESVLEIRLKAKPMRALAASIFPLSPELPHQTNFFTLSYETPGGLTDTLRVEVPVRFQPTIWVLLIALLVGACIGSLIPRVLPKSSHKWKDWPWAIIAAFLISFLLWIVGAVLVSNDSRFRILGLELDPFQVAPVIFFSALVGLIGFRSVNLVMRLLGRTSGGEI